MSEDWDLFAVVRSCSSLATSINAKAGDGGDNEDCEKPENTLSSSVGFSFEQQQQHDPFSFRNGDDRDRARNRDMGSYNCNELQDSCKPFLPSWCSSSSSSSSSSSPSLVSVGNNVLKQEQGNEQDQRALGGVSAGVFQSSATTIPPVFVFRGQRQEQQQQPQVPARSRKRKNQQKRTICHVTQENLSSDMWAWRKYGQKPIKGSPYPRNYYRCSSTKGCLARKQVERSNLDPDIFIVTYTGEHSHPRPTHRNSLAGSTRNKPQPLNPTHKPDPETPGQAKPGAAKSTENLSPTTPLKGNNDVQGTHADEDFISQEVTVGDDDEIDDDGDDDHGGDDDEDDGDDDDDEDVDGLLIPNLAVRDREDLFSDMQGFAGTFATWTSGDSSAAGSAGDGGG